jgi:hypothetical protein
MNASRPIPTLVLTPEERQSALYRKLVTYFEERRDLHRRRNDNPLPQDETQRIRGEISECKAFLALVNPTPLGATDT